MANNRRRSPSQEFTLYKPPVSPIASWALHGRISRQRGDRLVDAGVAEIVNDAFGNHEGYRLLVAKRAPQVKNGQASAKPTAVVITVREMDLLAGRKFRHGKSQTEGKTEEFRLTRVHPVTLKPLPPEDEVERAVAKFRAFTPRHLQAAD